MIKTWSYSRLKTFEQCPYRAYLEYYEKRPRPEVSTEAREASNRGTQVHKEAELFVMGEGELTKNLKKHYAALSGMAEEYAAGKVQLEGEWGFNTDWEPCDYWSDDIWLRVKLDLFHWTTEDQTRATAWDYKTGKKFGNEVSHNQQGQIYTLAAFMKHPPLEIVDTAFVYLDHNIDIKPKTYTREKAMKFLPQWDRRAKAMTEATSFPPKANSQNCRFCPYSPNPGGDGSCEWGVPTF